MKKYLKSEISYRPVACCFTCNHCSSGIATSLSGEKSETQLCDIIDPKGADNNAVNGHWICDKWTLFKWKG